MWIVFATHDELGSCRVSGHSWQWIKVHYATAAPWIDEVEWECRYCGEVEYTEL